MLRSEPYQDYLLKTLKKSSEAAAYLTAALEDGHPGVFLQALRNVIDANGGIGRIAEGSGLNRQHLYRILSKQGNPELSSLDAILKILGFEICIKSVKRKRA